LSWVYLIRHGQAGTREDYDALSELGVEQARRLGEYFAARRIEFRAAWSGELQRQRQTAAEVAAAYERAGLHFPEIGAHAGWNEFDLDAVYRAIAPALARDDERFHREYDALRTEIEAAQGNASAAVHRRWSQCDVKVVEAWVGGKYPYTGESWSEFCRRIAEQRAGLNGFEEGNVAVFTSATPTAVWAGLALDIEDYRVMRLAAVLFNTSFSILRLRGDQLRLFSFNNAPHLDRPELRTHR
jgi:broad specificity phosphatase PhoE